MMDDFITRAMKGSVGVLQSARVGAMVHSHQPCLPHRPCNPLAVDRVSMLFIYSTRLTTGYCQPCRIFRD